MWFFVRYLCEGIFVVWLFLTLAHTVPPFIAYLKKGYGVLYFNPAHKIGTRHVEQGIAGFPAVPFISRKKSAMYRIVPVHMLSWSQLPVIYYLLEVTTYSIRPEVYIVLPSVLRSLLLSICDCVLQHDVERGEATYIGGFNVKYAKTLNVPVAGDDYVILQRNFVQFGRGGCVHILLRDVLYETGYHLGAEVRAQMKTWQIPALRTTTIS